MPTADRFEDLQQEALAALAAAPDDAAIDAWRVEWLGRQDGRVTSLLRSVREQPPEERAAFGQAANGLKTALEDALAARQEDIRRQALAALSTTRAIDVTLPGRPQPLGRLHPVTQTLRDCLKVFQEMGFRVAEGPEVEWAYYNFDAARIPEDHPARDMWDTIWVNTLVDGQRKMLLRTHTTPTRSASWSVRPSRPSASSFPASAIARRQRTPPTSGCSPRSRASLSTRVSE